MKTQLIESQRGVDTKSSSLLLTQKGREPGSVNVGSVAEMISIYYKQPPVLLSNPETELCKQQWEVPQGFSLGPLHLCHAEMLHAAEVDTSGGVFLCGLYSAH